MPDLLSDVDAFPRTAVLSGRVHRVLGLNPSAFTGPGTNTYLVGAAGRTPVLIDTGSGVPEYLDLLAGHLARHGVAPVEHCLLTHVHPDHVGGAAGLHRRYPAMTFHKRPWPGRDERVEPPLQPMDDGERFAGDGFTLRAIHTPGHAEDHLCFYLEEERTLFTGDVVLGVGTTVIPAEGGDLGDYLDSLRRLQALALERLYPGHGPVIEAPQEKLAAYLEHRLRRERQIVQELEAGARSVADIVGALYRDYPAHLHGAAGQSVASHLRKLEREGRVAREGGEPPRYRLVA